MDTRIIRGDDFSNTELAYSVCSHLKPILELLVQHGNAFDASNPLDISRGGSTRFVEKPIDFQLIQRTFEIPSFIELNPGERAVICRKCWCDLAERQ